MQEEAREVSKIKKALRAARFIIVVITVVTLILLTLLNIDNINIDNFRRLLAKIDFSFNSSGKDGDGYVYYSGSDNVFAPFKDGLAVYNMDGLKVFDEKGNRFTGLSIAASSPAMESSGKYIMVYDRNGTALNIANSFALVFSKTFENPLQCASLSQSGGFVVVTDADGYKAQVIVYNSSFHEVMRLYSAGKYVVDAQLSDDGQILAVAAVTPESGDIRSTVDFYKIGNKEAFSQISLAHGTVFDIQYKSGGALTALTDKAAYTVAKNAKTAAEYSFDGLYLTSFSSTSDYTALVLAQGMSGYGTNVVVLSSKGKALTKAVSEDKIHSIGICGKGIAVFTGERLNLADFSSGDKLKIGKSVLVTESFERIIASGNNVFLIAGDYAKIERLS